MCVKLRLRVQIYLILCSHLCNVSQLLTIVYKERKHMTYVASSNIPLRGSKTLFRECILEIFVTHNSLCLFTRNTWRMYV